MALKIGSMNKKIEEVKEVKIEEVNAEDVPGVRLDAEGKAFLYVPKNWKG